MNDWLATSASRRGSSHGVDGPNQDAVRTAFVDGVEPTWVVAVSDGHGGTRYVRSQSGAQLAVDVAVELLTGRVGEAAYDADLLREAAPSIVESWRTAVLGHLAEHPFTADEESAAGGPLYGNPLVAYGATLLVALVSGSGVRLAQIGDGDALVRSHGFAVRPVPGDERLVANATTSLCLDTAPQDFRFAELPDSAEVDLVLLASDGYGNSFAAKDWWHTLVGDVAWYVDVHGFDEFSTRLPEWLAESALVGGDDVTAAVLARKLPVQVATPAPERTHTAPDAVPVAPRRRRRPLVAATLAGLVAGAFLVGATLMLTTGDEEPDPPGPPGPSTTVTQTPPRQEPQQTLAPRAR